MEAKTTTCSSGGPGDESFFGGDGSDALFGGPGNDVLVGGGSGNDTIIQD